MAKELSRKYQKFVDAYVSTLNAAEAARRAGYSDKGGGARVAGHRLLQKAEIATAVDVAIAENGGPIRTQVRDGLTKIAFAPDDAEDIKPADRLRALEILARATGMLSDRQAIGELQARLERLEREQDAEYAATKAVAKTDGLDDEIKRLRAQYIASTGNDDPSLQ